MRSITRPSLANLLWLPPLLFLALFYFFPLASILQVSFARGEGDLLAPFLEAFSSPAIRRVIGFTFWQAALSTLLTLLFGLPGAYLLARYRFPRQIADPGPDRHPLCHAHPGGGSRLHRPARAARLGQPGLMDWFDLSQPPIAVHQHPVRPS